MLIANRPVVDSLAHHNECTKKYTMLEHNMTPAERKLMELDFKMCYRVQQVNESIEARRECIAFIRSAPWLLDKGAYTMIGAQIKRNPIATLHKLRVQTELCERARERQMEVSPFLKNRDVINSQGSQFIDDEHVHRLKKVVLQELKQLTSERQKKSDDLPTTKDSIFALLPEIFKSAVGEEDEEDSSDWDCDPPDYYSMCSPAWFAHLTQKEQTEIQDMVWGSNDHYGGMTQDAKNDLIYKFGITPMQVEEMIHYFNGNGLLNKPTAEPTVEPIPSSMFWCKEADKRRTEKCLKDEEREQHKCFGRDERYPCVETKFDDFVSVPRNEQSTKNFNSATPESPGNFSRQISTVIEQRKRKAAVNREIETNNWVLVSKSTTQPETIPEELECECCKWKRMKTKQICKEIKKRAFRKRMYRKSQLNALKRQLKQLKLKRGEVIVKLGEHAMSLPKTSQQNVDLECECCRWKRLKTAEICRELKTRKACVSQKILVCREIRKVGFWRRMERKAKLRNLKRKLKKAKLKRGAVILELSEARKEEMRQEKRRSEEVGFLEDVPALRQRLNVFCAKEKVLRELSQISRTRELKRQVNQVFMTHGRKARLMQQIKDEIKVFHNRSKKSKSIVARQMWLKQQVNKTIRQLSLKRACLLELTQRFATVDRKDVMLAEMAAYFKQQRKTATLQMAGVKTKLAKLRVNAQIRQMAIQAKINWVDACRGNLILEIAARMTTESKFVVSNLRQKVRNLGLQRHGLVQALRKSFDEVQIPKNSILIGKPVAMKPVTIPKPVALKDLMRRKEEVTATTESLEQEIRSLHGQIAQVQTDFKKMNRQLVEGKRKLFDQIEQLRDENESLRMRLKEDEDQEAARKQTQSQQFFSTNRQSRQEDNMVEYQIEQVPITKPSKKFSFFRSNNQFQDLTQFYCKERAYLNQSHHHNAYGVRC